MSVSTTPPATSIHVVVIEDNTDLGRLFSDLLEVLGCTVGIASTVRAGLDEVANRKPSLVFCDLFLIGEDGFSFAQRMKDHPEFHTIRLIAITGADPAAVQEKAYESGFERVLFKPVRFAEVQSLITSVGLSI